MIYDEFNYRQDTGKILGVHPVFRVMKLKASFKKMTGAKAQKHSDNLKRYINRDARNLEQIKDPLKRIDQLKRIAERKEELALIETIHKLNE